MSASRFYRGERATEFTARVGFEGVGVCARGAYVGPPRLDAVRFVEQEPRRDDCGTITAGSALGACRRERKRRGKEAHSWQ